MSAVASGALPLVLSDAASEGNHLLTCLCVKTCHCSSCRKALLVEGCFHNCCTPAGDDFDDNFGFDDAGNTDAGAAAPSPYTNHASASYQQGPQQGFGGAPTSPGGVQPPEILNCSCNLQCSYIMAKTAKNDGRWFYRSAKWPRKARHYSCLPHAIWLFQSDLFLHQCFCIRGL